jgi:23S rRNA (cytidine1920-2'-O)/16S rRNA (cytidine1409-2'-O)-methyltransferase
MNTVSERRRIDQLLVERGLFESRARAQEAIAAGLVSVAGTVVSKASAAVPPDAALDARQPHPWVSRGGMKLAHAFDHFGTDPTGRVCLDVGSSTGGFTHVLLSRGAARVHAVDVGHGQFHPSLAGDPRVDLREGCDARSLTPDSFPAKPSLITFDVSFIPLSLVIAPVLRLAAPSAEAVMLVKPQFEAGRQHLKKGLVRDEAVHRAVCDAVAGGVAALGWSVLGVIPSPIAGGDGNREFLLAARREASA